MKKTHTINIGHSIFNIDEDAYEVLYKYLDSIKTYFNTIDNEGEIMKDFELRIAENFSSKTSDYKKSIDLNDVKNTIKIMGTLEDFEEIPDNDKNKETQNNQQKYNNKLYRDSSNRIIAGVCSGIAQYFKIDPIIVRVIFFIAVPLNLIVYIIFWLGIPIKDFDPNLRNTLYRDKENGIIGGVAKGLSNYLKIDVNLIRVIFFVSLFFGGAGLLFYLFLWFFTKEAKTIGQKMNMSGFNVNLSNIEEFIKKKTRNLNKSENTITRIFLFPFRLVAPLINALSGLALILFKALFSLTVTIIIALSSALLLFIIMGLYNEVETDHMFYDLINAIPNYLIVSISINQILTIILAILTVAIILFKTKIKRYLIIILFVFWLTFLIFNIMSIPSLIIEFHESGILPKWIKVDLW